MLRCGRPSSTATPAHLCGHIASSVGCENPKSLCLRFARIKVEAAAGAPFEGHVVQEVRRRAVGEEAAATLAPRGQRGAENSVCVIVRGCDVRVLVEVPGASQRGRRPSQQPQPPARHNTPLVVLPHALTHRRLHIDPRLPLWGRDDRHDHTPRTTTTVAAKGRV